MKDGRKSQCKVCDRAAAADRYRGNPERFKEAMRARYAADPETHRERSRNNQQARRLADPEGVRAYTREGNRKRRAADPEPYRVRARRSKAKRRAIQAGAAIGPVDLEAVRASRPDCYLCGRLLAGDVHLDHIVPLARGGAHSNENLAPTHDVCNLRKGDRLLAELDWYAGSVDIGAAVCHDGATTTDEGATP